MKIKFNHYERVAGLFVGAALVGSLAVTVGVALKKGWFSSKVEFQTTVENAEGLHEGTSVQVAGLRAGSVTSVELQSADEVLVRFKVLEKFHKRIRSDSHVQVIRPFIIGEKVLDITVGSESEPQIPAGGTITSVKSIDVMDLVSGRKLGPFLGTVEALSQNLRVLAEAFADPQRMKSFVSIFDRLDPLVTNLNKMAAGVTKVTDAATKKERIEILISNLTLMASEMGKVIPILAKEGPTMAEKLPQLVDNLAQLTEEFKKLTPAITAVAPELPRASQRAIEALDEAVITLKAMQKSFFLRGSVSDVKEEEEKRNRQPASEKSNM